jgi:uncharacterized coiled-coil DUF342 family protein
MDKTRVDDMLIEMITPKVKEIEEKFSNGEGLTQDDINTLLLKSQYNHINHLDDKLNETVESVKELRNDFNSLEERLTGKFITLEQKVNADIKNLEQKIQTTIQEALNKNMMLLIVVIGFFMTLSKVIDKF